MSVRHPSEASSIVLLAFTVGMMAIGGCRSPVLDEERDLLGDELPDVEPSEFHRPGQPCLRCHDSAGGSEPEMVVAGTIFATPEGRVPVERARITIEDPRGNQVTALTNCVGNFFITREEWPDIVFPLRVSAPRCGLPLEVDPETVTPSPGMDSLIHRDGACAGCHQGAPSAASPGWVYCYAEQPSVPFEPDPSCPGRVP
ncbi:MAG: hypothetical protein AAF715_28220 [Myxococcota bacterium]